VTSPVLHVRKTLDVLRQYYANREGQPHQLNAVQVTVYLDGLANFSPEELEAAARAWMRDSQYFPKLSELLTLLSPKIDADTLAHTAWARLEREIRRIGAYRGAQFTDAVFGEAVRQTFGSWSQACRFDVDSPGWAIRRQTFLAVFKSLLHRSDLAPVTLLGQHRDQPELIGPIDGMPRHQISAAAVDRSAEVMAEVRRRAALLRSHSNEDA
jgi:hypothetical protein